MYLLIYNFNICTKSARVVKKIKNKNAQCKIQSFECNSKTEIFTIMLY